MLLFADGLAGAEGFITMLAMGAVALGLVIVAAYAGGVVKAYRSAGWRGLALALAGGLALVAAVFFLLQPPRIVSLTIEPAAATLANGTRASFRAQANYADGSSSQVVQDVVWTAGSPSESMDPDGTLTGLHPGAFVIQACYQGCVGSANARVTNVTIRALELSPKELSLTLISRKDYGQPFDNFSARAIFSDGTNQDVTALSTWSSSNTSVALVKLDLTGQPPFAWCSAGAAGKATIRAQFQGSEGTGTCTVKPAL
jgi:hypothetical protein